VCVCVYVYVRIAQLPTHLGTSRSLIHVESWAPSPSIPTSIKELQTPNTVLFCSPYCSMARVVQRSWDWFRWMKEDHGSPSTFTSAPRFRLLCLPLWDACADFRTLPVGPFSPQCPPCFIVGLVKTKHMHVSVQHTHTITLTITHTYGTHSDFSLNVCFACCLYLCVYMPKLNTVCLCVCLCVHHE
jgi:hypothetical protein